MLKRWKKLGTKVLFKNPWWTYRMDTFSIPDGITGQYHYVMTDGSSMIVPFTNEGKIILVNQYRYLCERESLEFPCGSIKQGSSYLQTAQLELAEETGYRAETLEAVAEFNPYNGVSSEICQVFFARNLHLTDVKADETEEFELHFCSPAEIDSMICTNQIRDGMSLAAWSLTRHLICKKM
ncbi:MAG: NUDIX hydrolase [SAR324 cluster bacterium]|nr:NUDIX hydrolase [SAR324 cluster bacterium]